MLPVIRNPQPDVMYIPLRPSGQLLTNQKAVPGACAKVECGTLFKIQNFTQFPQSRLPVFIYLNLFVKPGHSSQETRVLDALP